MKIGMVNEYTRNGKYVKKYTQIFKCGCESAHWPVRGASKTEARMAIQYAAMSVCRECRPEEATDDLPMNVWTRIPRPQGGDKQ